MTATPLAAFRQRGDDWGMRLQRLAAVLVPCVLATYVRAAPQDPVPTSQPQATTVRLVTEEDRVRVLLGDQSFTDYRFKGHPFPLLYPVLGVDQKPMTRRFPIEDAGEGEAKDHPHHRSLWFTHGAVNGIDFWAGKGKIEHAELVEVNAAKGLVHSRNRWVADGEVVCTDDRRFTFGSDGISRWVDVDVTVHADHGALEFGDTKEGSMAMRVTPSLRLRGKVAKGAILNSEGVAGKDTWGKRARWVDYSGPVDGTVVGVTVMDHPDNPRHPTWWHARDYGLVAANPFGVHDFEGKPAGTGDLVVPEGDQLRLRYRFWFHRGLGDRDLIEGMWRTFAAE